MRTGKRTELRELFKPEKIVGAGGDSMSPVQLECFWKFLVLIVTVPLLAVLFLARDARLATSWPSLVPVSLSSLPLSSVCVARVTSGGRMGL